MTVYRFFVHTAERHIIEAASRIICCDDEEAIRKAEEWAAEGHFVEVREGDRLVARIGSAKTE
jgi:hypothetical protein